MKRTTDITPLQSKWRLLSIVILGPAAGAAAPRHLVWMDGFGGPKARPAAERSRSGSPSALYGREREPLLFPERALFLDARAAPGGSSVSGLVVFDFWRSVVAVGGQQLSQDVAESAGR